MTLPLIHFMRTRRASTARSAALAAVIARCGTGREDPQLDHAQRLDRVRARQARKLVRPRQDAISTLPDSDAKRVLELMADFVIARPM
jgi:hypothetical protein